MSNSTRFCTATESNLIVRTQEERASFRPLQKCWYCLMKGVKDTGCNKLLVPQQLTEQARNYVRPMKRKCVLKHWGQVLAEVSLKVILTATSQIDSQMYMSGWIIANCRYDFLLGIPWHVAKIPKTNYGNRTAMAKDVDLMGIKRWEEAHLSQK